MIIRKKTLAEAESSCEPAKQPQWSEEAARSQHGRTEGPTSDARSKFTEGGAEDGPPTRQQETRQGQAASQSKAKQQRGERHRTTFQERAHKDSSSKQQILRMFRTKTTRLNLPGRALPTFQRDFQLVWKRKTTDAPHNGSAVPDRWSVLPFLDNLFLKTPGNLTCTRRLVSDFLHNLHLS